MGNDKVFRFQIFKPGEAWPDKSRHFFGIVLAESEDAGRKKLEETFVPKGYKIQKLTEIVQEGPLKDKVYLAGGYKV